MPELPEVETIRRDLSRVVLNTKITKVQVRKPKMVRGSATVFKKQLLGQSFVNIERRGKLLMFALKGRQHYLLLHLKMTGQLIYERKRTFIAGGHPVPMPEMLPNKFTHIIVHFSDGGVLYFNDLRQFGYAQIVPAEQKHLIEEAYGIEPLQPEFTFEAVCDAVRHRQTALKNILLNQAVIAGLGNIYVDEVCFYAGIRPTRRADKVSHLELKKLYRGITAIITQAIKYRGTTFGNYRDGLGQHGNYVSHLKVYGRAGEACRKCQTKLVRTKINGRGTVYCPSCQR
ncbi:MAG: bifunctional DNA-formamidopyrimidine glycosylase/DNA-(apurinic or apyrimidinic site) lyase [Candidatus Andersenbacteria bacterium]